MKIPFVDLYSQYQSIKYDIDNAIKDVITNTAFIKGKHVTDFEARFAEMNGMKHCISVGNGTDSLYVVLKMNGIGSGDEVITAAISWISSSESISQTGAKPVFVDIEPDCYDIDAEKIEAAITKRTKAIIPVHLYGQPANMGKIKAICDKYNLFLLEDCAQAHFAQFENQLIGTIGNASSYSFYPGKNLGAYGDAGAILTNDDEMAEKYRMYANHGALKKHNHIFEGINSRMDGMQAAILNAKMPHILDWTKKRIDAATKYSKLLNGIKQVVTPVTRDNSMHVFHVYNIRAENRNGLNKFLNENGVQTAIHYPVALPNMPAYTYLGYSKSDFPIASEYQDSILSLPIFPEISTEQIEYVVETVKKFYK